jgi:hypothetical protein
VAAKGDREPGELADPVDGCAELGVVELAGVELEDPVSGFAVPGDVELAGVELGVGDAEAAGDVTVNCSTAIGVLPSAAG